MKWLPIILLFVCALNSNAQILHKVIVRPNNITNSDIVSIETQIAIAGTCSYLDSFTSISNNSILLHVCYLSIETGTSVIGRDTLFFNLGPLPDGIYTLKYVVNSTEDTADVTCKYIALHDSTIKTFTVGVNSINSVSDENFTVFPNPTTNQLTIQANTTTGNYQIISTTGQLLLQNTITQPNFTIDVSTLPPGFYFLQLSNGRQRVVKKFVKQ